MPQLHLYVNRATAEGIQAQARAHGLPVSRYLADLARQAADADSPWPDDFFDLVPGAWQGLPAARQPFDRSDNADLE